MEGVLIQFYYCDFGKEKVKMLYRLCSVVFSGSKVLGKQLP